MARGLIYSTVQIGLHYLSSQNDLYKFIIIINIPFSFLSFFSSLETYADGQWMMTNSNALIVILLAHPGAAYTFCALAGLPI